MRDEMEHERIAGLLQTLPRVEAPADFEYKVRARIARGRPASRGIPGWVKAAVPLGMVIAAAGYFGVRSLSTSTPEQTPAVASIEQTAPQAEVPVVIPAPPVAVESVTANSKPSNIPAPVRKRPQPRREPQGGSTDLAVGIGTQLDLTDRLITEAFNRMGVKGTYVTGGMKVDSADARSGLKTGDVVESVDGLAVTDRSTVKGSLAGKKVRVRRDGKTIDVLVKN